MTAPLERTAVAAGGVNRGDGDLKAAAAFGRRVSTSSCARKLVLNEESKRPAPTVTRLTTRHGNNKRALNYESLPTGEKSLAILGDAPRFFVFYSGRRKFLVEIIRNFCESWSIQSSCRLSH